MPPLHLIERGRLNPPAWILPVPNVPAVPAEKQQVIWRTSALPFLCAITDAAAQALRGAERGAPRLRPVGSCHHPPPHTGGSLTGMADKMVERIFEPYFLFENQ